MIEEIAIVVEADAGQLWLETTARSACTQCSSGSCGTSVIAKLFGMRRNRLQLDNHLGATAGQQVVIGIHDELLVRASIRAYLMPILMMVIATIVGHLTGASEGIQILLSLGGLTAGLMLLNRVTRSAASRQRFTPKLLRIARKRI